MSLSQAAVEAVGDGTLSWFCMQHVRKGADDLLQHYDLKECEVTQIMALKKALDIVLYWEKELIDEEIRSSA